MAKIECLMMKNGPNRMLMNKIAKIQILMKKNGLNRILDKEKWPK